MVHADLDVLDRGHVLEEADVLEGAPHAELRDLVGRLARDVGAVELDQAHRGLVDAREHVEERRLAGAVRPDQTDDRLVRNHEVDVVDGDEAAELLANLLHDEEVVLGHHSCRSP
jgi:hypothetical protein